MTCCAECAEPRRGLTFVPQQSMGATQRIRMVGLCVDCHEAWLNRKKLRAAAKRRVEQFTGLTAEQLWRKA